MTNNTDGETHDNVVVLPTAEENAESSASAKPAKKAGKKPAAKKAGKKPAAKKAGKKPAAKKPATKDKAVKKDKKPAKKAAPKTKRTKTPAGTKAQTQVPIECMKLIKARARDEKIKPADVVRSALFKGLGFKPAA